MNISSTYFADASSEEVIKAAAVKVAHQKKPSDKKRAKNEIKTSEVITTSEDTQ